MKCGGVFNPPPPPPPKKNPKTLFVCMYHNFTYSLGVIIKGAV